MKFRLWRKVYYHEYKDVEAESREEALDHHTDPRKEFIITEGHLIETWWLEARDT